jgi:hypothetical protein
MKERLRSLLLVTSLSLLVAGGAKADEAADRKAEIQRKKDEARKKAQADKAAADKAAAAAKAAADKAAVDAKAAADKAAVDAKAAADKAAADAKAAADKAAADAKAGSGGTTGTGGATSTASGGKGGATGAGGKGAGGAASTSTKVEEKDAPLPASDIETLRKDRPERRKSTVERLRRRWGSLLANDKGAADLKLHSRRVAFLQRTRLVAEAKKDKKTVELVDELLTQEDDRHSKAMNSLREGALSVGAGK